MKFLILFICLLITTSAFAEVNLFRYTDKISGDERGLCYSGKDGNSAIDNPEWNSEVIPESKKEHYIAIHQAQIKQKQQEVENALTVKKNKAKAKLASLGFSQDEIDGIIR